MSAEVRAIQFIFALSVIEWVISAFSLRLFSKVLPFFPPLWPPAHRASGPEGKEGQGEILSIISDSISLPSLHPYSQRHPYRKT